MNNSIVPPSFDASNVCPLQAGASVGSIGVPALATQLKRAYRQFCRAHRRLKDRSEADRVQSAYADIAETLYAGQDVEPVFVRILNSPYRAMFAELITAIRGLVAAGERKRAFDLLRYYGYCGEVLDRSDAS